MFSAKYLTKGKIALMVSELNPKMRFGVRIPSTVKGYLRKQMLCLVKKNTQKGGGELGF